MPPHAGVPSAVCKMWQGELHSILQAPGPECLPQLKPRSAQSARHPAPSVHTTTISMGQTGSIFCGFLTAKGLQRPPEREEAARTVLMLTVTQLTSCSVGLVEHVHVRPLVPRLARAGLEHDPPASEGSVKLLTPLLTLPIFHGPDTPDHPVRCLQDLPSTARPGNPHWSFPWVHKKTWNWCLFPMGAVSHIWSVAAFTAQYNSPGARGICHFKRKQLLMNTKGVTDFALPHPLPFLSQFSCHRRQPSALPAPGLSPWDNNISKQSQTQGSHEPVEPASTRMRKPLGN